ncbi:MULTISPECIES: alpha-1,2-fucosyltransferase [unclassified Empedobacter]|uniref:alpha-1,2-fucosyltransferase n=1 Tax=unclassified Empedobacter TaxID=2643773 RepID=UPI0025BE79A6|nr:MULTISPECIES: alpha-1,2-fucosyltransferase [unclassified Empedobacter]
MVIVNIIGGLGNQLFQYAFGKYLEKKMKYNVKFEVHTNRVGANFTSRDLDISKLNVQFPIASQADIKKYKFWDKGVLWRIERKLAQKNFLFSKRYIVQENAHSILKHTPDNAYYDGYWQCYEYVDAVKEELLNEFSLPEDFTVKHSEILDKFANNDSVAIHIRRGDYIKIKVNAELFEVCDMSYYNLAMKSIKDRFPNAVFYIFTQDTEWAKENFIGEEFHFVEGNSAIDDMLLMSFCKHNIIANSTFSWWSAWLNRNPNKLIISPLKWYKGKMNIQTINLIPTKWIRI